MERIKHKLVIVGDPFLDYYLEDNIECFGGVLNVINNYKSIFEVDPITYLPNETILKNYFFKLNKVNNNKINNYYSPISNPIHSNVCLISDYNRGTVNHSNLNIQSDIVIVDSKYNSFDHRIINHIPIKIYRSNHSSFVESIFEHYDYVILSDASNDVFFRIKRKKTSVTEVIKDVNLKCSIGAGDTMLATIGGVLVNYPFFEENQILEALLFAKQTCADVVSQPYTSVSKKTYRNFKCTLPNLMK